MEAQRNAGQMLEERLNRAEAAVTAADGSTIPAATLTNKFNYELDNSNSYSFFFFERRILKTATITGLIICEDNLNLITIIVRLPPVAFPDHVPLRSCAA